MFFSYTASVVLVSLALVGSWCLGREIWEWLWGPRFMKLPGVSFLVVVKDMEHDVEGQIRNLMQQTGRAGIPCDVVVVDWASEDLTPYIIDRLVNEYSGLKVVHTTGRSRPAAAGLPLCEGAVIHVLELGTRLTPDQFALSIRALLRSDNREVAVKRRRIL